MDVDVDVGSRKEREQIESMFSSWLDLLLSGWCFPLPKLVILDKYFHRGEQEQKESKERSEQSQKLSFRIQLNM